MEHGFASLVDLLTGRCAGATTPPRNIAAPRAIGDVFLAWTERSSPPRNRLGRSPGVLERARRCVAGR